MSDRFTPAEIQRIAALASLELGQDEQQAFARQLGDILSYVDALRRVDTTGVPPTAHPSGVASRERDDVVRPSLSREETVAKAPDGDPAAGLFRVPRVIG